MELHHLIIQKNLTDWYTVPTTTTKILKEDIGEPIAKQYVRAITGMTTTDEYNEKLFLPQNNAKQQ